MTKLFIVACMVCMGLYASAATLSISPAQKSTHVSQSVSVDIVVSSSDQAINVVSGRVIFDRTYLRPVSASKSGTIVKFWIQEPSAVSSATILSFEGVILNPGYTGNRGQIITLTFAAMKEGQTDIAVTDGAVLANDGVGTNVFSGAKGGTITILPKIVEPTLEPLPIPVPTPTPVPPPTPIPAPVPVVEIPTQPESMVFEIVDYPREVRVGQPITIDGRGGDKPIMVYAVRADLGGPLSGTIVYKSLTEGGYDKREEASVSDQTFKATFSNVSSGRYAFYARDGGDNVTKVIFVDIKGSFWISAGDFLEKWWWLWVFAVILFISVYSAWKLGQKNGIESRLDQ